MRFYTLNIFITLTLLIIATSCTKEEPLESVESVESINPTDSVRIYIKNCDDNSSFFINDDYFVQNNVWGFYASSYSSSYSQCIFYDSIQPTIFGWEWNLDSISKYPSYPRIEYGWNPWVLKSTTPNLPRKLKSLNSVTASFDKEFSSKGVFNTSFDIWITDSEISQEKNISAEIMIWIDAHKIPDTELTLGELLINNESYDFYKNTTWNKFPLFIFVQKVESWNGQLNVLSFLSYLFENEHISSDNYLVDIEFGNEIWSGSGFMELENYKIEID